MGPASTLPGGQAGVKTKLGLACRQMSHEAMLDTQILTVLDVPPPREALLGMEHSTWLPEMYTARTRKKGLLPSWKRQNSPSPRLKLAPLMVRMEAVSASAVPGL